MPHSEPSLESQVLEELRARLAASPYPVVRGVFCRRENGSVVLQGRVPSYYLKQVALSTTKGLRWSVEIDDRIEVVAEEKMSQAANRCSLVRRDILSEIVPHPAAYCPWASPENSPAAVLPGRDSRPVPHHQAASPADLRLLRELAEEGDVCAMYRYGHACGDSSAATRWLRSAAGHGCVPAVHESALVSDDPYEALHWLREAAEEGYVPAILDFARTCEDPAERAYWLRLARTRGPLPHEPEPPGWPAPTVGPRKPR